jgi:glycine/D-amino acid oxidase-like deaminating enzyme
MSQPQQFEVLILGSGEAGKLLAWHMAQSGRRTAVVERRWIGGSFAQLPDNRRGVDHGDWPLCRAENA